MGILNALGLLEEGADAGEFSAEELIKMARQNAQRLHRTLVTLLDMAALDSGTFRARLREVDLSRLARSRLEAYASLLRDQGVEVELEAQENPGAVLADPQKLGRAFELALQAIAPRAEPGSKLQLRISSSSITFHFRLTEASQPLWDQAWTQAIAGLQAGVSSPASAFHGVMQSEQAFLSRMEEGLGAEFLLIHEVLRLHEGRLSGERQGAQACLRFELRELSSEDGLKAVLESRAYDVSNELGSVALVLVEVPAANTASAFYRAVKRTLFRASDAVYQLPGRGQLALVLDDCKPEDAPTLLARIQKKLGKDLKYGFAQCPADGLDPALLLELAQKRLSAR